MWAANKILATSNDMRMLGREREINGVFYFSHLCTFGAFISINLMDFAMICKDRIAVFLNPQLNSGILKAGTMRAVTVKSQLYSGQVISLPGKVGTELASW